MHASSAVDDRINACKRRAPIRIWTELRSLTALDAVPPEGREATIARYYLVTPNTEQTIQCGLTNESAGASNQYPHAQPLRHTVRLT